MVKKFFTIAMFFMPLCAFSGNLSYPMLKEGRTWVYEYHDFDEEEDFDHEEDVFDVSYTIQGDTVIGGVSYVKLMRQYDGTSTYYAALREEGTAVFRINAGKSNEYKTLEFDPTKLSSMPNIYSDYTERKEVIKVNGREFVRHIYEPVDDSLFPPRLIAVEGVGFWCRGLVQGVYMELPPCQCDYEFFKACYEDGECIFTNEDFNTTDVIAQTSDMEYCPFSKEGKTWETQIGFKENIYCFRIDGDTLINGEKWKKVYNYKGIPDFGYTYYSAIRDVGKKVYAIEKGSSRPRLLYDFGLKVGNLVKCGVEGTSFACILENDEKPDTISGFPFVSYLKVERIDIITAHGGLQYRRFMLTFLDSYQHPLRIEDGVEMENVIWVEGVGSGAGPFSPWLLLPPRHRINLNCFINRECIFSDTDFYDNANADVKDNADVNGDGEVNAADIVKIVNEIMGK